MFRQCLSCGEDFIIEPYERWKKRCFPCWRELKSRQERESVDLDFEIQKGEVKELKRQNRALTRELREAWTELEVEQRKVELLRGVARLTPAPTVDHKRMRQLLQLCHPDKHGGSTTATDVTQWLLKQRQEVSGER